MCLAAACPKECCPVYQVKCHFKLQPSSCKHNTHTAMWSLSASVLSLARLHIGREKQGIGDSALGQGLGLLQTLHRKHSTYSWILFSIFLLSVCVLCFRMSRLKEILLSLPSYSLRLGLSHSELPQRKSEAQGT